MPRLVFPSAHLKAALPPDEYALEIKEIEAELDELHPVWQQPARSRLGRGIVGSRGITDLEIKARVKWLLQRRKHLYDGKDYEVIIRTAQGRDGHYRMVAMPIIPKCRVTPESLRAAARTRMAGRAREPSLPQIAAKLGVPLKRVEGLVMDAPPGANLYHHARRRLADEAAARASEPIEINTKPKKAKKATKAKKAKKTAE